MRERLQSVVRVSAMLVSMAVLMGVASVANLTSLTGLTRQFSFVGTAHANDIQVTNTSVAEDSGAGVRVVSFDLSWENSWRVDNLFPDDPHNAINWDAGWVFLKYRTVGGEWKHATLMEDGFDAGVAVGENMGSGALMQVGLVDPGMAWDASENPGVGVMVYRGEAGAGRFAVEGAQLRWNFAADGVSPEDDVAIALFAIEMVYVAPGAFYLGSGGTEDARFVAGGAEGSDNSNDSGNSANTPFLVTGNWDGCVSDTEGCLWAAGEAGANSMDDGGMLASGYPIGFSGFYAMKFEVSQQQYVDFLNTLPVAQAQARAYVGGEDRNGISYVEASGGVGLSGVVTPSGSDEPSGSTAMSVGITGYYTTSTPYVANNYMSWVDAAAYLDWAGLRPMTELEFEKAARGYANPVANEYAWGSTDISSTGSAANYSDLGEATESVSQGNAVYNGSNPGGPARVGIFAGAGTSREQAGAGYWGMMELSGNVEEMVVTAGNEAGRGFTGMHGDGVLSASGEGTVTSWPGLAGGAGSGEDGQITGVDGSGLRGGSLTDNETTLSTAVRTSSVTGVSMRGSGIGLRGARTMPAESITALTVQVLGVGEPNTGGTVSPSSGSYATGTQVELTATPFGGGWFFTEWMGDVPGGFNATDTVLTVTMDSEKNLTALFEYNPRDTETEVVDVVNPATGVTWMDRNLGASRAATSSTDTESYGDLYQWGRAADGHQLRTSGTTSTLSSSDQPSHGDFIIGSDWRSPKNDNLWQGANGVNNPCPVGYRLPTDSEWGAEHTSWSSNNSTGAYGSPLKLPVAGFRYGDGSLNSVGSYGRYWSSSVGGTFARSLLFHSGNAGVYGNYRAIGISVRCRKDGVSLKINVEGNGSVDPVGGTFELDAEVEITATPAEGWVFSTWIGDLPDEATTNNPITITMDSDKSVTAVIEQDPNFGRDTDTQVVEVVNPATGVTWMDRNLGASRAATSSTDSQSYGDLYQWGRAADGHEKINSVTTIVLSSNDQPGHGDFITTNNIPFDWRSPRNDNLWQGVEGVNIPCPVGYRLPTASEWVAERQSWGSGNSAGAYGSPLKLPAAGYRYGVDGSQNAVGSRGLYWSGSVDGTNARGLSFYSGTSGVDSGSRAFGRSVRCLKDGVSLKIYTEGNGSVDPVGGTFELGAEVELMATPAEGWVFSTWTGDVPENLPDGSSLTDSVLTVIMDSDKSITAIFEQGLNFGRDTETEVVEVVNPATGVTWMDRNLGASQVATSLTDVAAYGDLYQWGRAADGHEKRASSTRNTLSSGDWPGHSDFITNSSNPFDWRSPGNDNLWQGADGLNTPCPVGYRLPTRAEWEAERQSWSGNNSGGAYGSPLKLPVAGYRDYGDGSLVFVDSYGYYWSSSVHGTNAWFLFFDSNNAYMDSNLRSRGLSVRCRKDGVSLKIYIEGNGSVDPVGGTFELGAEVELTAVPEEGWVFSTWTGDVSADLPDGAATDSVLMLTMDIDKSVTAVFEEEESWDGWPRDTQTAVVEVVNPATGVTWMDRNLGASRVATSSTDSEAYGDLYQWGRAADGHQKRTSSTRNTLSGSDQPGHDDFILALNSPNDWRSPGNDNLWQAANGVNNPCPIGYRLPTESEWDTERQSWSSNNRDGAYDSPLKLPVAGTRKFGDGSFVLVGLHGYYWSSSVSGTLSKLLDFSINNAFLNSYSRAYGLSVRCLKD